MADQSQTTDLPAYRVLFTGQDTPCGRLGCGTKLLCCRPDCPLVTVDIEPGLKRIYTRAEFVSALEDWRSGRAE